MSRRVFLQQVLAAAVAAPLDAMAGRGSALRVGVVGGGIVGASIAYHLARAGARVTLFEKAQPASGATRNSFAWLNAFVADPQYRALRLQSLAAYHQLDRRLKLGILWGGYANWANTPAQIDSLRASAAQLQDTAFPVRPIDTAALRALAPGLQPGPLTAAFFSRIDGHLNPVEVTRRFLSQAQRSGAMLRLQCEVRGLDLASGKLSGVQTSGGPVAVDRLVIAGGVNSPQLAAMAGFDLKLDHAPGILAHSRPTGIVTPVIFDGPGTLSFKQMADGSIVGTDSPDPPDIPVHAGIRAHPMDFPDEALRAMHGNRILSKIGAVLPAAHGVPLERLTLGFRPMPTDELPVIGALPGAPDIYLAVMHSGVTLAPIVGRYVTQEIMSGVRAEALARFRPERFVQNKTARA